MTEEKINRISQLTALSRQRELTQAEQAERAALRREYIDSVTGNLAAQLDNTVIVDEQGNQRRLGPKN